MNDQFKQPAPLVDEALEASCHETRDPVELRDVRAGTARLREAFSSTRLLALDELRPQDHFQPLEAGLAIGRIAFMCSLPQ